MASRANNAASAGAAVAPPRPRSTCTGCLQPVAFPYAKMGCDCYFCSECLPNLVGASLNGGSFPASCCGLPIDTKRLIVQALVGPELTQRHDQRAQEEDAAAEARRAARDNSEAVAVRAFARQQGWAECGRCGRLIDRVYGCNHMTCPCSYQFCYACGKQWNECPCRQQPFGAPVAAQGPLGFGAPVGAPLADLVRARVRAQARAPVVVAPVRTQVDFQADPNRGLVVPPVLPQAGAHPNDPIIIDLVGDDAENERNVIDLDGVHDLFERRINEATRETRRLLQQLRE